jgi:hypothetical protein
VTSEGNGSRAAGTRDPEQIQRDIERTREELAQTVAAVAEKADVKGQAARKVDQTKARVDERREAAVSAARRNPAPLAIGGALALALIVWLIRR